MVNEEWEVLVQEYKAKADAAFRSSNYGDAIANYSNALELDPQNHVILSNRSAANLKASNKSKSLADAKACIAAHPTFIKGYSRLGAAQQSLGRWRDAKASYQHILIKLDPNNSVAKKELEHCEIQIIAKDEALENQKKMHSDQGNKDESVTKISSNSEEDLLDDFFSEVEATSTKKKAIKEVEKELPKEISNQKKNLGSAEEQIERLLAENFQWRNLNPFFVLALPHTSTYDDIGRRYKALSLLLHPDKCCNKFIDINRAKLAYDEIQRAKKQLNDEDKARHVRGLAEQGMKVGKQFWQRQKNENKDSLECIQSKEVQRVFAKVEFKRREVEKRERKYEQRERQHEEDEVEKERRERQFDKSWREGTRVDKRIGNWREFQKTGKKRKA